MVQPSVLLSVVPSAIVGCQAPDRPTLLDFADGYLPNSWVSVPRYHHQYLPDEVQFEKDGLGVLEKRALEKRGHVLKEKNRRYGNMQAILWDKKLNKLFAASDPRGEGKAVVISQ